MKDGFYEKGDRVRLEDGTVGTVVERLQTPPRGMSAYSVDIGNGNTVKASSVYLKIANSVRSSNPIVANAIRACSKAVANAQKIVIRPSPTADTRYVDHPVTTEELTASTNQHIEDVRRGMDFVAKLIREAGKNHDWTKLRYMPSFFEQFSRAQETGVWGNGWYDKIHTIQERHHLNDRVPKDVNLIDVLEHIVDCVMAGKGRAGEFKPDLLGAGVLERAYMNTQKLISDAVVVEEKENT